MQNHYAPVSVRKQAAFIKLAAANNFNRPELGDGIDKVALQLLAKLQRIGAGMSALRKATPALRTVGTAGESAAGLGRVYIKNHDPARMARLMARLQQRYASKLESIGTRNILTEALGSPSASMRWMRQGRNLDKELAAARSVNRANAARYTESATSALQKLDAHADFRKYLDSNKAIQDLVQTGKISFPENLANGYTWPPGAAAKGTQAAGAAAKGTQAAGAAAKGTQAAGAAAKGTAKNPSWWDTYVRGSWVGMNKYRRGLERAHPMYATGAYGGLQGGLIGYDPENSLGENVRNIGLGAGAGLVAGSGFSKLPWKQTGALRLAKAGLPFTGGYALGNMGGFFQGQQNAATKGTEAIRNVLEKMPMSARLKYLMDPAAFSQYMTPENIQALLG